MNRPTDALAQYELLYRTAREEILLRLSRDSGLQIQLIVSVGAIAGLSAVPGAGNLILVAPLLAIYFSVVIAQNRWMIHSLGSYLRDIVEPKLSDLSGVPVSAYWDTHFRSHARGWERLPRLEPLIGWGVFIAVFSFLGLVGTTGATLFLLTAIIIGGLNLAATVYVFTGFQYSGISSRDR